MPHSVLGEFELTTADEWISILSLARQWNMDNLKDLAAGRLLTLDMDPVSRIALWKKYSLNSHQLYASYSILCSRQQPLMLKESQELGVEAVALIAQAREKFIRQSTVEQPEDRESLIKIVVDEILREN